MEPGPKTGTAELMKHGSTTRTMAIFAASEAAVRIGNLITSEGWDAPAKPSNKQPRQHFKPLRSFDRAEGVPAPDRSAQHPFGSLHAHRQCKPGHFDPLAMTNSE